MPVTIHISPAPKKGKLKYTNMDAYLLLSSVTDSMAQRVQRSLTALKMHDELKAAGIVGYPAFKKMQAEHGVYASIGYCRGVLDTAKLVSKQFDEIVEDEGMLTKNGKVKL